jgi:hypothetical protein
MNMMMATALMVLCCPFNPNASKALIAAILNAENSSKDRRWTR